MIYVQPFTGRKPANGTRDKTVNIPFTFYQWIHKICNIYQLFIHFKFGSNIVGKNVLIVYTCMIFYDTLLYIL